MAISCNVRKRGGGHGCPLPAIHGASQQAAHGRPAYPGGGRYLAIGQSLGSERDEKPIASRELPEGIARGPEAAILVPQRRGFHGRLRRLGPRQPPESASHAIPAGIRRHGEQPAAEVRGVAPGLEVRQELQERLLHHILRVVAMAPEEQRESVDRGPVLAEQVAYRRSRILRVRHSCCQMYNAPVQVCDPREG